MIVLPLKRFYAIRHGKTVSNAEGYVAGGSLDTPLTEKGREEALFAGRIVQVLPNRPKIIVHSNLSRAKDTANLINQDMHLPMMARTSIAEWYVGDFAGKPLKEWVEFRETDLPPPNGESYEVFENRVITGLSEILSVPEEPVLIVTHGGVIRAIMRHYKLEIGGIKNCNLLEFDPDEPLPGFPWTLWNYGLSTNGVLTRKPVELIDLSQRQDRQAALTDKFLQRFIV